jgi:hypothetical protein
MDLTGDDIRNHLKFLDPNLKKSQKLGKIDEDDKEDVTASRRSGDKSPNA